MLKCTIQWSVVCTQVVHLHQFYIFITQQVGGFLSPWPWWSWLPPAQVASVHTPVFVTFSFERGSMKDGLYPIPCPSLFSLESSKG